mgnify:CR=1 FL=1
MARPRKNAFDVDTETRVLEAAEERFGAAGFARCRLEDIAADAGIKRSSLLYHFGSKDALYAAVVRRAFAEIARALGDAMAAPGDYRARLDGVVTGLLAFEAAHRPLTGVILRELIDGSQVVGRELAPIVDALEGFVTTHGADCVPAGVPVRAAIMQLIVSHLACASAGELGTTLWGPGEHTRALTRALLVRGS